MSHTEDKFTTCVYGGEELSRYGFGEGHPFGPDRFYAFWQAFEEKNLNSKAGIISPVFAARSDIERFHTSDYVAEVERKSRDGHGYLDYGDTPAFPGIYEAACYVVGSTVDAVRRILAGDCRRVFIPIAGLHHASRESAAGFCVFNDCGVAIEVLRAEYGVQRIAYVDIDAHQGNGVFYSFEEDPDLILADIHEDGRYLYPGTGGLEETGKGAAKGTKMNVPVPPYADDELFAKVWVQVEAFLDQARPEFILLQCGADSLAGDPITHLAYTANAYALAAKALCRIAEEHSNGRILAVGGGGYNRANLAEAWTTVVDAFVEAPVTRD